jgi:hypothetical protein
MDEWVSEWRMEGQVDGWIEIDRCWMGGRVTGWIENGRMKDSWVGKW